VNGAYTLQGTTADGREYYVNGAGRYLFYDSNCGGDALTYSAKWMIAPAKPSTAATTDLVGDGGTCGAAAALASTARTLPSSATWQMFCTADTLVDTVLSIAPPTCICELGYSGDNCETERPTTTTSTRTTTFTTTSETTTTTTTATTGVNSTTATPTTNGATMSDASTTLAEKTTAPGQTTTTTPTPSVDSSNETNSGRTIAVVVAVIVVLLAAAVGGLWCFSGQLCCSTAHGNDGGDLDGFRNETIEMMDNPMRAAATAAAAAAAAASTPDYVANLYEPTPTRNMHARAAAQLHASVVPIAWRSNGRSVLDCR